MTVPAQERLEDTAAARPRRDPPVPAHAEPRRARPDAGRRVTSVAGARSMQRLAGNRAVSALLAGPTPDQVASSVEEPGVQPAAEIEGHVAQNALPATASAAEEVPAEPMAALAGAAEVLPVEAAPAEVGADALAVEPVTDLLGGGVELPPPVGADSAGAGQPVAPDGAAAAGPDELPVQRLAVLAEPLAEGPELELPPLAMEEPEGALAGVEGEAQSHASGVGAAAGSPSGGGLLASLLNRARSWVSEKVSAVTGTLGSVGSRILAVLRAPVAAVTSAVRSTLQGARDLARDALAAASAGVTAVLDGARAGARSAVRGAFSAVRSIVRTLAGPIRAAVQAAISSAQDIGSRVANTVSARAQSIFHRLLDLPNRIAAAAVRAVTSLQVAVASLTARFAAALGSVTDRVAAGLTAAVGAAAAVVQSVVAGARRLLAGMPGLIARLVQPVVDRLLTAIAAFVARVQAAAQRAIERVRGVVQRAVAAFAALVQRAVAAAAEALRRRITAARDLVNRGIALAISAARSAVVAAQAAVRRAVHAVLDPIRDWLIRRLTTWLAPKIKAALAAIPPAVLAARLAAAAAAQRAMAWVRGAAQAAAQVAEKVNDAVTIEEHDVLRGLMKPDGDHLGVGVSLSPEVMAGAGVAGTVGATVDLVFDYQSHEIGMFLSPALGMSAQIGPDVEFGKVAGTAAWGTVLSFGANRRAGVRAGYQGAFLSAGASVQGGEGLGVSTGGSLYVGAAPLRHAVAPLVSAAEHDPHVPDTRTGPPPVIPGTPAGPLVPLPPREIQRQTVFFDTGQAQVKPAGIAAVNGLLDVVAAAAAANPDAQFTITTVGGASLRWRHPDKAGSAADNLRLSWQRADAVNAQVSAGLAARGLSGRVGVRESATGSQQAEQEAERLHLAADDDSQAYRDTVVSADEIDMTQAPAVPPTVGPAPVESQHASPGGWTWDGPTTPLPPGHWDLGGDDRPGQGFYDPRQPGSPFHPGDANVLDPTNGPLVPDLLNRPTIGSDTTFGVMGLAGAGINGGAGPAVSFSFPLGAYAFPPESTVPLRVLVGMIKLNMDVATMSPAGGLRDVSGIVGAFIPDEVVNGVADFVFPLPPGYTD